MLTEDYTVRLETFEGPLDLLLYLIRRAELDVTEISIAEITDQYLRHISRVDDLDVEVAGEFLVTAATLIEIKSRCVMPPEDGARRDLLSGQADSDGQRANPAAELVRQLLEYKQYRDAADALEARRDAWDQRYPAGHVAFDRAALREAVAEEESRELEELELYDILEAFQRIVETVQLDRLGDHQVTYDETPIELHATDIVDQLTRRTSGQPDGATMNVREIFEGRTRSEVIGLFLALLELARRRAIRVFQDRINGEISMRLADAEEPDRASVPVVEQHGHENAAGEASWDDDDIVDDDDEELDDDAL